MDRLLDHVNRDAGPGRYRAIVAAPARCSTGRRAARRKRSRFGRRWRRSGTNGGAGCRAHGAHRPDRLSDIASDRSAARLRQLSDEVSRIASTLARLSTGPAPVRTQPSCRRSRATCPRFRPTPCGRSSARGGCVGHFYESIFADPAWDMLLDLMEAEIEQPRVAVSSLCIAAAVPATTALRWLKTLTEPGPCSSGSPIPRTAGGCSSSFRRAASQAMRAIFADAGCRRRLI